MTNLIRTAGLIRMRWNLIWYLPLAFLLVYEFVLPNAVSGYHNLRIMLSRWVWLLLISPSAALFIGAIFASVLVPVYLLVTIPAFFNTHDSPLYRRRYFWSTLVTLGVILVSVGCQFLAWGSFPFGYDEEGYEHVRIIPFYPWPSAPVSE